MFDTKALEASLAVGVDLGLQGGVQFLAQETEDVLGGKSQRGVFEKAAVEGLQRVTVSSLLRIGLIG